ncbi:MAG: hypothetical protein ACXWXT_10560, partial [Candidatus Binatia bacterium]
MTETVWKQVVHAVHRFCRPLVFMVAIYGFLLGAIVASAQVGSGWLLWHRTYTTRAPKDVKPSDYVRYVIQNEWVILNAVETRDQCRALLRDE